MPEWLLTKEEWEAIIDDLPAKDTCGQCREALAQAALRKVAAYVKHHTAPVKCQGAYYKVTCWGAEEWAALMNEAGLEDKETPDAKA